MSAACLRGYQKTDGIAKNVEINYDLDLDYI